MPSSGMVMRRRVAQALRAPQARRCHVLDRLGPCCLRARGAAMRVLVTGGTGFVGKPACDALRAAGPTVTVVSRGPGRVPARAGGWDALRSAGARATVLV